MNGYDNNILTTKELEQCRKDISLYRKNAKRGFLIADAELSVLKDNWKDSSTLAERAINEFLKDYAQEVWEDAWIAREKMKEGHYMICSLCLGSIERKRLLKYPIAICCLECQGNRERNRENIH